MCPARVLVFRTLRVRWAGMSSLDPKDAVADYSSLNEGQMNTLNQWESFFEKVRVWGVAVADVWQRYSIVGRVVQ